MKWLPLPAVAITAAACLTALISVDICFASRSHRKVEHKKPAVSRSLTVSSHLILRIQASPATPPAYSFTTGVHETANGQVFADNPPPDSSYTDASAPSRGKFDSAADPGSELIAPARRNQTYRSPATPLSRGANIARTALAYRGMPYRFGGRSERSGFDCSGLVQAVCAKWGIYLPRVAGAQFTKGAPIPQNDLQPGDLVFFKNTYKAGLSHVGIYIGEGQFVHAAGRKKGVKISSLADSFYQQHWAGARRLDLKRLPHAADESTFAPPQADDVIIEAPMSLPTRKAKAAWQPRPYRDDITEDSAIDARMAGEGTTTGHPAPHSAW